jgi:hypothetical protein
LDKQIQNGVPVFVGTVQVYEGILTQNTIVYDSVINSIVIPDLDVDTSTLKVEVFENGAWSEYTQPVNYLNINASSKVYMLQEGFNGFEFYFGDNVFGKTPTNGSNVRLTYVVTSGNTANGALNFALTSSVTGMQSITTVSIVANTVSSGGLLEESIDSIRNNAKDTFSTQNRAVTPDDYAAMAKANFATVKDVIAWDGSINNPPKYGKVVLCIEPSIGDTLSPADKNIISTFLQSKGVGNIKVEYSDPIYLDVIISSNVSYNINNLQVGVYELQYIINAAITNFALSNIQKFKGAIRYSQLVAAIDASDYSITSNETMITLGKELSVNLYAKNNFAFTFDNQIKQNSLFSSTFFDGLSEKLLYIKDSNGIINVYYSLNGIDTLYTSNVGSVNYTTGEILLSNISIVSLNALVFKVFATPISQNIYSSKNVILRLKQENITVSVSKDTSV